MTNDDYKKYEGKDNKGMSVATAGAFGLLLGAVGTAAIMLSDREVRKRTAKRAGEMSHTMGKWSSKTMKNLQGTAQKTVGDVKDNLKENLPEMKEKQKEINTQTRDKITRSVH